jgi:hypothetical protein
VFTDTFLDAQAWEMPMRRDDPSQRVDADELASRIGRAGVDGGNGCGTARSALRRAATLISDLTSGTAHGAPEPARAVVCQGWLDGLFTHWLHGAH